MKETKEVLWRSEALKIVRKKLEYVVVAMVVLGEVTAIGLMLTGHLWLDPPALIPLLVFGILILSCLPLFVTDWRSRVWARREEKWREAHWTSDHVAEAISSRPFGPRHYSDDADDLFRVLLLAGAGPYSPATMERVVREVAIFYANDGLSGLTQLCMLKDVEFADGKWDWSEKFREEVWQFWLNTETVEEWWQTGAGKWDPMAQAW